jgi:hypothetical protein
VSSLTEKGEYLGKFAAVCKYILEFEMSKGEMFD